MKIILVWQTPVPETKILLDELVAAGHEIVYWVGENPISHFTPKGTIFHDHYDAWDGKPAEALKDVTFPPASADLISKYFATESIALSMMDKRYDNAPVSERKHIYYSMLAYWKGVLDMYRPDMVVFETVPHSIYNYILYDMAKARGTRTLFFEETWAAPRLLMYEDFWRGSDELRAEIKRIADYRVAESDLPPDVRAYWEARARPRSRVEPAYTSAQRSIGEGWGLIKHRLRIALRAAWAGNLFSLTFGYVKRLGRGNLKSAYMRVMKPADWNVPFVYFPLHFQPECTTSPQGGAYNDQLLAVETLASALPDDWEIYVKEHPAQWWMRTKTRYSSVRYPGYYERLARIPRVRLVPIATNTFDLNERSQAVAVITGTAGWEALLRGKCPLVFGIPWYRDCPGIFQVNSVESCAQAFLEMRGGARASREGVLAFLQALEQVSIKAYIENQPEKEFPYSMEESVRHIADRLCQKLRSYPGV